MRGLKRHRTPECLVLILSGRWSSIALYTSWEVVIGPPALMRMLSRICDDLQVRLARGAGDVR
jgi:hypothetical protein